LRTKSQNFERLCNHRLTGQRFVGICPGICDRDNKGEDEKEVLKTIFHDAKLSASLGGSLMPLIFPLALPQNTQKMVIVSDVSGSLQEHERN
jgi:hypothetical protein